ncbi:unnamed protein product [Cuscuta epithymum]|uniref:Retrotransposon gag domain-containing protein n=1 Tax=Cuscuta epithymum TaxID=186058 RepID=A0AAV0C1I1_9ASTE|nr:unnamed protein product [Cuscuta epithymum]
MMSLKARRKHVFIDGTLKKPAEGPRVMDWDPVNSMIVSWILRSMEANVAPSIPYHEEARSLWLYFEKRYSVANGPRLQQLRAAITECKQTKTMSVDAYYTALTGLYNDDKSKLLCSNCKQKGH